MSEIWLVAHDFSPCSDEALDRAAKLAAGVGARLEMLHVHPDLRIKEEYSSGAETFEAEQQIKDKLAALVDAAKGKHGDFEYEVTTTTGAPVDAILGEAKARGANMIIAGTHGRTGLAHLVLGSVAERLARESPVPVLVVKAAEA
jgi:nucleotide-binding universal stress UspA family protein